MELHIDIETRSTVDLRKTGPYVYAEHPDTEIIVVCYARDNGPVQAWLPLRSTKLDARPMPPDLAAALVNPAVSFLAHNSGFERTLLSAPCGRRLGFPDLSDVSRWDCTAARAAGLGLPRSLEGAGAALGLSAQKDHEGHRLMLQMCKPRKARKTEDETALYWWDDEERYARLATYCARDVEVERLIATTLPSLSTTERAAWMLTERMNDRGVLVDQALLASVAGMIEQAESWLDAEIWVRTEGRVKAVTDSGAIARWLTEQGLEDHIDTTTRKASVAKAVVTAMIDSPDLDPLVRQVLMLRRDGGGSSAKKWKAIAKRIGRDGRARGALVYCGASATGRWSSRGIQLQNLPRGGTVKSILHAADDLISGASAEQINCIYGAPLIVASELLRPAFIAAPGKFLARGDYSQIEARVNPWLAGAEWKLDMFRAYDAGTGPDLYKVCAAGILGIPVDAVTKQQRQGTGKVPELALGFGGGSGALQNMAKAYSVTLARHPRDERGMPLDIEPVQGCDEWIKRRWRATNPEIVGLWKGLEAYALECMSRPFGEAVAVWTLDSARRPVHKTPLSFVRNSRALCMRLPSGRGLVYWTPRVRKTPTPWGEKWTLFYRGEDAITGRWDEWPAWGGLLCENAVQAVARDVMRDALLRMEAGGVLPVLTVHDEGIVEIDAESAAEATAFVDRCMAIPVSWAPGLPIAADSSAGPRYVKAD